MSLAVKWGWLVRVIRSAVRTVANQTANASSDLSIQPTRPVEAGRLARAQGLRVEEIEDGYWVIGGSEPHRATLLRCDCADFRYGHLCKHILAVHRHRGRDLEVGQMLPVQPTDLS